MTLTPALAAHEITKTYGGLEVLKGVDISVQPSEIHALIGPNGAGKSTLFKILSGEIRPTTGKIELDGVDITGISPRKLTSKGVGRNFQVPKVFNGLTVAENLTIALESADRWRYDEGRDGRWVQRPSKWIRSATETQLEQLSISNLIDRPVAELAHGDRKLVEFALTLAQDPSLLLLDEPMAGMSPDEVYQCSEVIERLHEEKKLAVLLVEHDMEAVFRLASVVSVLVGGTIIASGLPDEVRTNAAVREAYLGKAAS